MNKSLKKLNLTELQKGIAYHCLSEDDVSLYLTQVDIIFNQKLNIDAFKKSWEKVVSEINLLRCGNYNQAEESLVIHQNITMDIPCIDLSVECAGYIELKKRYLLNGISLKDETLYNLVIARISQDKFHILWTHHHILFDASSFMKIINRVFQNYKCLVRSDYILPNQKIECFPIKKGTSVSPHWKNVLDETSGHVPLTIENVSKISNCRGEEKFIINNTIQKKLNDMALLNDVTMNTLLQLAWGILLCKYSNKQDVVFGAVRSYPRAEVKNHVGLLMNTLPVRMLFSEKNEKIVDILKNIREQHCLIRDNIYDSLQKIHFESNHSNDTPIFNYVFDYKEKDVSSLIERELSEFNIQVEFSVITNYGLMMEIIGGDVINGRLTYNKSCFNTLIIRDFIDKFKEIINCLVSESVNSVSDIYLNLSNHILENELEFNKTFKDLCGNQYLQELLEIEAKKNPNKIAVISSRGKISYQQLNQQANQVGYYLRACKSKPNDLVAVIMEKGWEQVVACYGILKAGSAYLPIDADFPDSRIKELLKQGKVKNIISQDIYIQRLSTLGTAVILNINDKQLLNDYSVENLIPRQKLEDLAYVIFTSGSTGKPKGVMIDHLGAMNTIQDINSRFNTTSNDVVLGLSALNFDLSVYDIFGVLGVGGTLIMPAPNEVKEPQSWLSLIKEHKVTIWNTVPALMQMLVEYCDVKNFSVRCCNTIRLVLMSGDWIPLDLPEKIKELCGEKTQVISLGGATEGSIWSILYPIDKVDSSWRSIPYGRPMWNQKFYVLDEQQRLQPMGVPGELYIGGIGVAKGYWQDLERTANSFIDHERLGRIYRTGDMGRYLPSGLIEFIGRLDNQVKIRGYRIELGEIEFVVKNFFAIKDVIICVLDPNSNDQILVAYYLTENGLDLNEDDLKFYVRSSLPVYMVPNMFVKLDKFPLSDNGKVDHKALPLPNKVMLSNTNRITPVNTLQQELVNIWKDILDIDDLGITESFFALGGHSLKVVQLCVKLKQHFGCEISVKNIFLHSTIMELEKLINSTVVKLKPNEIGLCVSNQNYISSSQRRIWFLSQLVQNKPIYNITFCYRVLGRLDENRLRDALEKLIEKHMVFRAEFTELDGDLIQKFNPNLKEYFNVVKVDYTEEILNNLIIIQNNQIFDFSNAPLLKVSLIQGKVEDVLIVTVHHIIFDAWSIDIFIKELSEFYTFGKNNITQECKSAGSYVDYGTVPSYDRSLSYWRSILNPSPPVFQLPVMKNRPSTFSYNGKTHYFDLPEHLVVKLRYFSKNKKLTMSNLFLTALFILFEKYGQEDGFCIGVPVTMRNDISLDGIIGCYLNILLVKKAPLLNENFAFNAELVQNQFFESMDYKNVPFEVLVNEMNIGRHTDHHALFQTMFTYQHSGFSNQNFSGLKMLYKPVLYETAKFDLTTFVFDYDNEKISIAFEYCVDLFEQSVIEQLSKHYVSLLDNLVSMSDMNVSDIQMLTKKDEEKQLITWNNTNKELNNQEYLQKIVEKSVERYPEKMAVVSARGNLKYHELNKLANKIAYFLQIKKVQTNELVAIVMNKGWEEIVAALAILKSGAAYLPISADFPQSHIQRILKQGEVRFALCQSDCINLFNFFENVQFFPVDDIDNWKEFDEKNLVPAQKQSDLAYVIFTSGSTGKPKGVMIDHLGAVNTIQDINSRFQVTSNDVVLGLSALNFDLSVYDIFGVLGAGGLLVLPDKTTFKDPSSWLSFIDKYQITLWNSVPAFVQMLATYGLSQEQRERALKICKNIRLMLMSGDWIPLDLPEKIKELCGEKTQVISLGGATEGSIWSILYPIDKVDSSWRSIPYGRPMWNQKFYVLDEQQRLQPMGVPGELYIGGIGVAKGYWQDLERTANSFIDHERLGRIYRTGDMGRYLPSGLIEFIGRLDNQVKIRGFRIELGEIEFFLKQHRNIKNALVVDVPIDGDKEKLLVAYVTVNQEYPDGLEAYLKKKLPSYMIPDEIIIISEFPLSPNGKIARKELPAPNYKFMKNISREIVLPNSSTEEKLVKSFSKVLKIDDVSVNDDFFMLGGHSMLATMLLIEIEEFFSIKIPLRLIFESPVLKDLAVRIEIMLGIVSSSEATQPKYEVGVI